MKKKILKIIIILLVILIAVLAGIFYPALEEATHEHEHQQAIIPTQYTEINI